MRRGEIYRVTALGGDPRRTRVYLVVSRRAFLEAAYSTVLSVPVYSRGQGLATEVPIGPDHGLKQTSFLRCDEVTSVPRSRMRDFIGLLPEAKMREVSRSLAIALGIEPEDIEDL